MNKTWQKGVSVAIVIAAAYAIMGYVFYRHQSHLDFSQKNQSIGRYSFPVPQSNDHRSLVAITPGNPFGELNTVGKTQDLQLLTASNLILLGTLSGTNPQAVVAEKNNPALTRILSQGESWLGEKVVSIRKGSIVIRKNNQKLIIQTTP